MKLGFLTVFLLGLASAGAQAAEPGPYGDLAEPPPSVANSPFEFRLGGFAHDPQSPEKGAVDLNAELLFPKLATSPNPLWNLLIPRPQLGTTVNFVGKTSNIYAGLTWDVDIYRGLFLEGSFGGAVNDGKAGVHVPEGFNKMGCNESFHENFSIGYHLTENLNLLTTIEHFSNAGLCVENRGLTNYGARLGYAF
jgi:hypothetical protein